MAQNYRIYINDNTLFIAEILPDSVDLLQRIDPQGFDLPTFYRTLHNISGKHYVLIDENPKQLFKRLKKSCLLIKAAGGLVENDKGDYLFIFRNGKWDLPKGKVEEGEKMKEAAVREVEEECGVEIAENGHKLCKTYHMYTIGEQVVLKKTNWYKMKVLGEPVLIPQKEEGIEKAVWLKPTELSPVLENTYQLISEILKAEKVL